MSRTVLADHAVVGSVHVLELLVLRRGHKDYKGQLVYSPSSNATGRRINLPAQDEVDLRFDCTCYLDLFSPRTGTSVATM